MNKALKVMTLFVNIVAKRAKSLNNFSRYNFTFIILTVIILADILVGILSFPMPDVIIQTLEVNGYEYMEKASVNGRAYFVKRAGQPFNIHVVEYEKEIWNDNLLLRNYFVTHKNDALKYAKLKQEIINQGVDTLLMYSAMKADFLKDILKNARSNKEIDHA